jgi:hypothetical protein
MMNARKSLAALAVISLLLAEAVIVQTAQAGPAQTGQGIMVNMQGSGDFIITQNQVWKFCNGPDNCTDVDSNTVSPASSYFDNAWDGNQPTVSCTPSGGSHCTVLPTVPGAPGADPTWVYGPGHADGFACAANKCTFWNGGDLQSISYTQTAQVSTGSGGTSGTWIYTYTYDVTPTQTSVDPKTAWYLFKDNSSVDVFQRHIWEAIMWQVLVQPWDPRIQQH